MSRITYESLRKGHYEPLLSLYATAFRVVYVPKFKGMRNLVRHRHDLESLKLEVGTACAAFQGGTHSMAVFSLIRIKRAVSDSVYVTGCEFVMLWCRVSVCSVEHVPVGGYAAASGLPVSYLFFCPYIPVGIGGVHPCLGWRGRDVGPSYSSAFACASCVFRRQAVVLEQGRFDRLVLGELGFQKGKRLAVTEVVFKSAVTAT